jgi:hypothetical protein
LSTPNTALREEPVEIEEERLIAEAVWGEDAEIAGKVFSIPLI